jgi:hypothetical protein
MKMFVFPLSFGDLTLAATRLGLLGLVEGATQATVGVPAVGAVVVEVVVVVLGVVA